MQRAVPLFRASAFAARVPARALHIRPAGLAGASPAQSHRVIVGKQQQLFQHRFLTNAAAWKQHKDVSYEELKPITEQPNDDIVIIDVREPDEVMMGSIPSAVNVPLSSFEKALALDEADFTKKYGFHKPSKNQNLIFFCLAGKRSATALDLARGKGYKNVRNYPGSYSDWSSRQNKD